MTDIYDRDSLATSHNREFMSDPAFVKACERGKQAAGGCYGWHWRVHVSLRAASAAIRLPGDLVECGTNKDFLVSAIMCDLDWDNTGHRFFLIDTFTGLDPHLVTPLEIENGELERNALELEQGFFTLNVEDVRKNFEEWERVALIPRNIPDTLPQRGAGAIAFMHIDLDCTKPEVATLEYFWEILSPGALVLLDDYAYQGFYPQKVGMDEFALSHSVSIPSLPTDQGLLIRPPRL